MFITEKNLTEILPDSAKEKLAIIAERTKTIKEGIDGLSKQEKKQSSALGVFLALLLIPVALMLFAGAMILAIWFTQNPLDTTAMFGIMILILAFVTFSRSRRG